MDLPPSSRRRLPPLGPCFRQCVEGLTAQQPVAKLCSETPATRQNDPGPPLQKQNRSGITKLY